MKTENLKHLFAHALGILFSAILCLCVASVPTGKFNTAQAASSIVFCKNVTVQMRVAGVKSNKKTTWKSSKRSVATINSKGVLKTKKIGSTVITAKIGKKTYKANLLVQAHKYVNAGEGKIRCERCGIVKNVSTSGSSSSSGKKTATKLVPMKKLKRYQYFRRYMSEAQMKRAYNAAVKIVKPLRKLNKKQQLIGIATALREICDNGLVYSMKASHYNDPYGYLILKTASCAGCARATGFCLNILGINYEHVNENQYSHQWARVKVGNKYWICDAFGLYCGPEPAVRKHPYLN